MNMNWLQSLIYGLVSGFTEFLPISSQAHQSLLMQLFGIDNRDPLCDFLVHLAVLLSLFAGCRPVLEQLRREQKLRIHNRRTHRTSQSLLDLRLINNAAVPMVVGLLVLSYITKSGTAFPLIAVFLLINGIFLYAPERMVQGNKDARTMSGFDSILIGIAGALSAFTGISRVGAMLSVSIARGADRQKALNWVLLLSIPAIITLIFLDFFGIVIHAGEINFISNILSYILSATSAYCGGYLAILLMKFLTVRTGFAGFAYYSWGAALFSFLLYLTVA